MKILVTGASGMLGSNLCLGALDAGHRVIASSFSQHIRLPGLSWYRADLTDPDQARKLLEDTKPEWIVNCVGATNVDRCEQEPEWANSLNIHVPEALTKKAASAGARLIHISTDAVFDGGGAHYGEEDEPHPINRYAVSKLEGERAVLSTDPNAAVIRTNFYGWSPVGRTSLAEWFLEHLSAGEECLGFTDVSFSPLLVNELAALLLRVMDVGLSGLYHAGSRDSMSKHDFGVRIAEEFELNPQLILQGKTNDADLLAPRPKNLTLGTQKIESDLEMKMPGMDEGIREFRRLRESGYSNRVGGILEPQLSSVDRG